MYFCYVDESGGFEAPNLTPAATPLMVLAGLVVEQRRVQALTLDYLREKRQYFPGPSPGHYLSHILLELKGADLRRGLRSPARNERRHVLGFLGRVVTLLERHHVKLIGRIWVKEPTTPLDPSASYAYAIQDIARHFDHFLGTHGDAKGMIICDGRMWNQNAVVSHSIFTMKMRLKGDAYPHLAEAPVFGDSTNHAGLQLADLVASALIFPMASRVYCAAQYPTSVHCDPHYDSPKSRFALRFAALEYHYIYGGRRQGGIVVSDKLNRRPSAALFG